MTLTGRAVHYTKQTAINQARRVLELRVIPGVDGLKPELQYLGFRETGVLKERHVPVIEAWAVEESPVRSADLSQCFRLKV